MKLFRSRTLYNVAHYSTFFHPCVSEIKKNLRGLLMRNPFNSGKGLKTYFLKFLFPYKKEIKFLKHYNKYFFRKIL